MEFDFGRILSDGRNMLVLDILIHPFLALRTHIARNIFMILPSNGRVTQEDDFGLKSENYNKILIFTWR